MTFNQDHIDQIVRVTGAPPVQRNGQWYTAQGQRLKPGGLGGLNEALISNPDGTHTFLTGPKAGATEKDSSLGSAALKGAALVGGGFAGGLALDAFLGSGAAAAGGSAAAGGGTTAAGSGGATAATAGGAAAASASPFSHLITSGLISTGTALAKGLIQSNAASKASNTLQQGAREAAAGLNDYAAGGNAAFRAQLAKYGITLPTGPAPIGQPPAPSAPMPAQTSAPTPSYGMAMGQAPAPTPTYTLQSMSLGNPSDPTMPPTTRSAYAGGR